MTSSFGFQFVCVSEPTSMLRIRATVVKESNGTVYTVFLAPRVLVDSHFMLLSILSQSRLWGLSTCLQCSKRVDCRTDGERPDGVTMIPWEVGKQLVWDVLVVDALAPSRLNQGSFCFPGTTATLGFGSTGCFRREQCNFHHASL